MNATQLTQALLALVRHPAPPPAILLGPPGVGKSSIVAQVAIELGLFLQDVRVTLLDEVDLRGLPRFNDAGRVIWCPPIFWPDESSPPTLLFLDEFGQARPSLQAACLQLLLDRRIGEHQLPATTRIVAASNRLQDKAGVFSLLTPASNRMLHFELEVDPGAWLFWAVPRIDYRVVGWIRHQPNALMGEPSPNAFASPRSWEFVSRLIQGQSTIANDLVFACVGDGAAADFLSWVDYVNELPSVDEILAQPRQAKLPEDPGLVYALCSKLAQVAQAFKSDDSKAAIIAYVTRWQAEYVALALQNLIQANPEFAWQADVGAWLGNHRAEIT